MPGDGKKPGAEFVLAVVLMAAFEDSNPGFLEKVFGQFAMSGEVSQITQQAMLILLDQTVEQIRIATAKTTSDYAGLGLHPIHEIAGCGVHATGYTGEAGEKMQGWIRRTARGLTYVFTSPYVKMLVSRITSIWRFQSPAPFPCPR